jgi:predicted 2-oxoglutarate/Fe(II)-dependent dioxygenase YbiX
VGFHINNDYDGGEYILYNPDSIIDKTPGIPYFFKSDRLHEISKITKGIRKSALLFVNYEDLIKKTTLI